MSRTNRVKDSERQRMLINYLKDGTVPEGFYVLKTKDNRLQFRRIKGAPTRDTIEHKIALYERKIEELHKKLAEMDNDNDNVDDNA